MYPLMRKLNKRIKEKKILLICAVCNIQYSIHFYCSESIYISLSLQIPFPIANVRIRANYPRINAQYTSLLWLIFNMHITDLYLFVASTINPALLPSSFVWII